MSGNPAEQSRAEVCLFHCGLVVAGQLDALFANCAGGLCLLDWKRCRNVRFDSFGKSLAPPLEHLEDCNGWLYSPGSNGPGSRARVFLTNRCGPRTIEVRRVRGPAQYLFWMARYAGALALLFGRPVGFRCGFARSCLAIFKPDPDSKSTPPAYFAIQGSPIFSRRSTRAP